MSKFSNIISMDAKDIRIAELEKAVLILQEENRLLRQELDELKRRLGLDSKNSSKPPSTDGFRKRIQSLRKKGSKKSGGQVGHKGTTLEQVESPDHVVDHLPKTCDVCQASLEDTPAQDPIKRQVFDMPQPRLEITEHRTYAKQCACGHLTKAAFPDQVTAPTQYGTRLMAFAAYMMNQQFIPEDRLQELLRDLFGVSPATGTLVSASRRLAKQLAPLQEEVLRALKEAPVKNADETGFHVAARTHWLQVLSNARMTHYRVGPKRKDLGPLEGMKGTMVHDHFKAYFTMKEVTHALCNAHHLRELKALMEIEKEAWSTKMHQLLRMLNRWPKIPLSWMNQRYNEIVREGLCFHEEQPALEAKGRKKRPGHNLLIRLRDFKACVLRFAYDRDVPFTNNQAEQDIRMMKVKQKISGGFRTIEGAQIFATIRGFISTTRKQNGDILNALTSQFA